MGLFSPRRRIRRTREGGFEVQLPEEERELLADLAGQLQELLSATTEDPSVRRLFPTAYANDPERDREYQQLVRDELLEHRLDTLSTLAETAGATTLDEAQLTAWLTAMNDLRLVLGTRLDVSEDLREVDADDPDVAAYAVYDYLGYVVSEAVDALAEALPPPTEPEI